MNKYVFVIALLGLMGCDNTVSTNGAIVIGEETTTYANAESFCQSVGGTLVELEGSADMQRVYDAWVAHPVAFEAIWVGNTLTNVEGEEYGYAMLRGGVLVTVEQDGVEHEALPACEILP